MSDRDDAKAIVPKFGSFRPRTGQGSAHDEPQTGQGQNSRAQISDRTSLNTTVPKFGSFKIRDAKGEAHEESSAESQKHGHRHRHERRHHEPDRHRRHERRTEEEVTQKGDKDQPSRSHGEALSSTEGFFLDTKGDPLILRYGSNDRRRLPSYRRSGNGRLLGFSGFVDIDRSNNRERFELRGPHDRGSIFRDKAAVAAALALPERRLKPPKARDDKVGDGSEGGHELEFMPLRDSSKRKRAHSSGHGPEDSQAPKRRAAEEPSSEESGADVTSESEDGREITSNRRTAIELSQRVKEHPADVQGWLDLADLQAPLLVEEGIRYGSGLAAMKLSLLEKALPHAPTAAETERLQLAIMREASKTLDRKALAQRWLDLTLRDPNSFALWGGFLDFKMTDMPTFSFEELREFYLAKLKTLETQIESLDGNHDGAVDHYVQWIYVFIRLTRFINDTGFKELATALWQAQLQLIFAPPAHSGNADDVQKRKAAMADFWDNEVRRIGEDENVDELGLNAPVEAARQPSSEGIKDKKRQSAARSWYAMEKARAARANLPARILEDHEADDPFRTVLFADLSPFIGWFPLNLHAQTRSQLLGGFLIYCGLPPASTTRNLVSSAWLDPFIQGGSSRSFAKPGVSTDLDIRQNTKVLFELGNPNAVIDPALLFSGHNWFSYMNLTESRQPSADGQLADLATKLIWDLVQNHNVEELAEYSLAMHWRKDPSNIKKTAKALLKRYPANIRLYNAYARIEHAAGRTDSARKVLSSALSLELGASEHDRQMLWNSWTWIELESGNLPAALARLCHSTSPEVSEVSPAEILKARGTLSSKRDFLLASGPLSSSTDFAESSVLLEYLAPMAKGKEPRSDNQGDISVALSAAFMFSDDMAIRGHDFTLPEHGRFLQFAAKLLYFHSTRGPYRPVFMQRELRALVGKLPQNTIFLKLFEWADASFSVNDPVNQLLSETVLTKQNDCITSRVFAIQHEMRKGTVHSTRAAFESAFASDACKGSQFLWRWYIRFCCETKELESKAKAVFYRAIAACPWSKDVALEAFETLGDELTEAELQAVYETLMSKGLRIHVEM